MPEKDAVAVASPTEVEAIIEKAEGITRKPPGWIGILITSVSVLMSLTFLYAAMATITTQKLRGIFLAFTFLLTFLVYPPLKRLRNEMHWSDWTLALLGVLSVGYMLFDFETFIYRSVIPNTWDLIFGTLTILLVLEACRRSTGWILPAVAIGFLAYAYVGPWLPPPWTHRAYGLDRLVGHNYMTLEGIFGVPLDVASTFIILFTIYGAVLEYSRAGEFFIDFSFAASGGKPTAAGRTVTLASFLLGGPSGSGVATTVTLGSVAYPMLARAGYDKESAGGLLSAGGIGAILSPPVLGAAAFLIAEFLKISYLQVIAMATVPTILYYWSIFLMVEFDAKKFGAKPTAFGQVESLWGLTCKYGYHFISLITIVGFMVIGYTPIWAVFWSTVIAFAVSFLRSESALYPKKLVRALESGSRGVLSVAATCACAGIIVGVVTLTGLGLKFSDIIIELAGGNLPLTLVATAVVVWVIGLAVPVTASYIIAAVMTAPALIKLGVPDFAAHMFIFYYAVLSEVSPPTALSPFAAAAITGGNPYKTTMMAWKYTLPAFLVPFNFTLHPDGIGLLLKGSPANMVTTFVTAIFGIAALAGGVDGWLFKKTTLLERLILIAAGLILVYPSSLGDLLGIGLFAVVVVSQKVRHS